MDFRKIQSSEDLKNLEPSGIFEVSNFESIKYYSCDCIDNLEWDEAVSIARIIDDKLKQVNPKNTEEQFIFRALFFWSYKLKLFVFRNFSASDQNELIKKNIVKMLAFGLDVENYIANALNFYGSEKPIRESVSNIISSINNSSDILGSNFNAFNQADFKPVTSNWIKEYQVVLRVEKAGSNIEPGAFHILKFMDSNQYVRNLNANEKDTLKSLLDLYNWLLQPLIYVVDKESSSNYLSSQKNIIPDSVRPSLQTPPVVAKPVAPPVVPKVKPVNLAEVMKNKDKIDLGSGSGIRFGGQESNQSISQSANQKNLQGEQKPKAQVDIEKKLEDLKKRKGSKLT